jgi:hypothetical protein
MVKISSRIGEGDSQIDLQRILLGATNTELIGVVFR